MKSLALNIVGQRPAKSEANLVNTVIHYFSEALSNAMEAKDRHVRMHSEEVAEVSQFLALEMGYGEEFAEYVHIAGHLHDIGKIGIPDNVLQKNGRLSPTEWTLIQQHPQMGADILAPLGPVINFTRIGSMVLGHHERYDGQGYPNGLAGKEIHQGARIIAVADSLSAMLQDRPYRARMKFEKAAQEVDRCAGSQFDPEVVEVFLENQDSVQAIFRRLKSVVVGTQPGIIMDKGVLHGLQVKHKFG